MGDFESSMFFYIFATEYYLVKEEVIDVNLFTSTLEKEIYKQNNIIYA